MSNLSAFQVQYKRDQNGNKRVTIPLVAILKEYQAYCIAQRIKCVVDAELCLATALKKRFHYRCNLKAKVPTVSSSFESEANCLAELMDVFVELATNGEIKYSRYRYMNGSRRCNHEDYYAQFAFGEVMSSARYELDNLLKSRKPHFNDHYYTKLEVRSGMHWTTAMRYMALANATTHVGYRAGVSSSDLTCMYKAAARIVVADAIANKQMSKRTTLANGIDLVEHYNGYHFEVNDKTVNFLAAFATYVADYNWYDQDKFKDVVRGTLFLDCNKVLVK